MDWADVIFKNAEVDPGSTSAPVPQVQVVPTTAPGKRGPVGTSPRTNYSRVNTGAPEPTDAGAAAQKMMEPKVAGKHNQLSEVSMNTMAARPTLQQMLKNAMAGASVGSSKIAAEATRQLENLEGEGDTNQVSNEPEEKVSGAYARKLASAVEYCAELLKTSASLSGPWSVTENKVEPGKGPGALTVMEAPGGPPPSGNPGQATAGNQPPRNPGLQKQLASGTDAATQLANDINHRPGQDAEASWAPDGDHSKLSMARLIKKLASGDVVIQQAAAKPPTSAPTALAPAPMAATPTAQPEPTTDLEVDASKMSSVRLIRKLAARKLAEDAINPAHISAGSAQAPQTIESDQTGPGGENKSLVPTTAQEVANFTRRDAKAPMKAEMKQYLDEPMMSAASDKVLANAFGHTGEAGAKISSVQEVSKVASARALMRRLAESAGVNPVTFGR